MWQTESMLTFYHSERLKLYRDSDKGNDAALTSIHSLIGIGRKKKEKDTLQW